MLFVANTVSYSRSESDSPLQVARRVDPISLRSNRKTIPGVLLLIARGACACAVCRCLQTKSHESRPVGASVLCTLMHLTQQRLFVYDCNAYGRLKVE
jgi:hypothetical protein